jgi:MFS family permease
LLLAPQGIGAALALPISGRLTDRLGGGRVVLVGCSILALATLPLAFVGPHTSYLLLSGVLLIRGLGLGASIQPSTAAAYSLLTAAQVPRATAALNALRQIGGSIGTALLAVVLQHEQAHVSLSEAFRHTFVWGVVISALALLPCLALVRAERPGREADAANRA